MGRASAGVTGREWEERLRRDADSQLIVVEFYWRLVCQVKAGGHEIEHEHEHRFTEHEHDEKQDHSWHAPTPGVPGHLQPICPCCTVTIFARALMG